MENIDVSNLTKFEFEKLIENNSFIYRLTGGLGNQLFGISEAYEIQRKSGKKAYIDVSKVEHTIENEKFLIWTKEIELDDNFKLINLRGSEFLTDTIFRNIADIKNPHHEKYLTGWIPSFSRIEISGLWRPGKIPNFLKQENQESIANVMHVRLGDYRFKRPFAPLSKKYYLRSIAELGLSNKIISLFTDEPDFVFDYYPELRNYNIKIINESDLKTDLYKLATAEFFISSNSTYSFWAYYFGTHSAVSVPNPFYDFDHQFCEELWNIEDLKLKRVRKIAHKTVLQKLFSYILKSMHKFYRFFKRDVGRRRN